METKTKLAWAVVDKDGPWIGTVRHLESDVQELLQDIVRCNHKGCSVRQVEIRVVKEAVR